MKRVISGQSVSKGIGMGHVHLYQRYNPIKKLSYIAVDDINATLDRYREIVQKTHKEIDDIRIFLQKNDHEKANIFLAHLEILHDIALEDSIIKHIKEDHYALSYAIHEAFDSFITMINQIKNEYLRERVVDLIDVRNRILRIEEGLPENNLPFIKKPVVLVAEDLLPSDTASLHREHIEAILTESGGVTSHTAIIAKSYEIPAILGIKDLFNTIKQDTYVIVDALLGVIIIDPDEQTKKDYQKKKREYLDKQSEVETYLPFVPMTTDGVHVKVNLNMNGFLKEELSSEPFVDGVGLFRSEFLYMDKECLPTEEEQLDIYTHVLKTFGDKPVILRTLDIGADKKLPYLDLPHEENPYLGYRAIRFSMGNPEIFKTQLRAAYRASIYGNLWLMFPMVSSMDDIENISRFIEEVKSSLKIQNIPFREDVKIGVMMEIPSLILISDHVAKVVDFASIGTNDLCQYLTAVDRHNPLVASYYQSFSPAMFRIIKMAVDAFDKANKPISICGELSSDPRAVPILLGLGIRHLSMTKSAVPHIKKIITSHSMSDFIDAAQNTLELSREKDIIEYIHAHFSIDIL